MTLDDLIAYVNMLLCDPQDYSFEARDVENLEMILEQLCRLRDLEK